MIESLRVNAIKGIRVNCFLAILAIGFVASSTQAASQAATLPAGTIIDVRLTTAVSSQQPSGKTFTAVVTVPVMVDGAAVIAPAATLSGKTADVKAAGAVDQAATMKLDFSKITQGNGGDESLSAQLLSVDNARESVGSDGTITGITESQTWHGRVDQGISKVATNHPELADILGSVRDTMLKQVDPSITYPSGVDMQIKLTKTLNYRPSSTPFKMDPIQPAEELAALVGVQPNRTAALKPPSPSDLVNLMFIGTEQELTNAFEAAGWSTAAALDSNSKMETARAIIDNQGYKEAPVSILTLDGRPPDLVFEKQTNTFSMRHHIRIWRRSQTFAGAPIWLGAGTHDTGIDFSPESRSFTHKIDSHIDGERAKVTNDLIFAHCVKAIALVDRKNLPPDPSNATGDKLITDGKIAVLQLQPPSA
jgi:hypothetical protein